jgi:hypothetical protein
VRRIEHGRRLAGSHALERLGLKLDRHDVASSAGAAHGRGRRFCGHASARQTEAKLGLNAVRCHRAQVRPLQHSRRDLRD